jgi:hypothetical protein
MCLRSAGPRISAFLTVVWAHQPVFPILGRNKIMFEDEFSIRFVLDFCKKGYKAARIPAG